MVGKFIIKSGELIPIEKATMSLGNIEYAYGFGVYETIKLQNDIIYFAKDHVERLIKSAEQIGLVHRFIASKLLEELNLLISKNGISSANIKMLLIGAEDLQDVELFIFMLNPLYPSKKLYSEGASVITIEYERLFPKAKTLNMLGSYLAFKKAKNSNCYDALFVDKNGNITEGTRTNFFTMKEKTIFSPPEEKVLGGITRKTLLYVARKNNFKVIEREIPRKDIAKYDGAFLTTSISSKIIPVRKIDDFDFKEISLDLKLLSDSYSQFFKNCGGKFDEK
ncbi:hypothetical protein A2W48_00065 [Candidatus Giovannonibacteria bacterium RIFCSPHIGHO2_12_44_12]|uniref:Aminotransferase class IV n=3 Tax=Candidatus Giovannoniibacteriota TaxID=1752738 RepID=A0A1F5WZ89_9BACT|nr:MAG: Aminotransferase class IV [Parcubacteria group bacterium GW2011_GWB1_44_7]OGF73490.1 MAG: hypothetical protein A2W57_03110 [Candidatus Giovannonibacteria bacterium RIFCSPHIGHO2_02_43_16]OGF80962.1 MAG: hypothetical protein A2W48_00065 [Candidatus Giovannonibacteria bacterium RIFCSPHIGHO2_12_44_12]OGF84042.1 MAG: hypothetical protein A2Z63_00275 [Candidatus Giovannonibacteria bacterium RIFCSPLOWO2_02_44_8]